MSITAADLPILPDGSVYHIGLTADYLAPKVILVGDPKRVFFFKAIADSIEFEHQNREFHSLTGLFNGKRMTTLS